MPLNFFFSYHFYHASVCLHIVTYLDLVDLFVFVFLGIDDFENAFLYLAFKVVLLRVSEDSFWLLSRQFQVVILVKVFVLDREPEVGFTFGLLKIGGLYLPSEPWINHCDRKSFSKGSASGRAILDSLGTDFGR